MSSSQSGRKEDIPIPDIVVDPTTGNRYMKVIESIYYDRIYSSYDLFWDNRLWNELNF